MENLAISALEQAPPVDEAAVEAMLRQALATLHKKIIVLDDDPTGIQTVHGVPVYTSWDEEAIEAGFAGEAGLFFVLTNSRSFSAEETERVHREIGEILCRVSRQTGKDYLLVSRGDSTLRGHYPLETATLREALEAGSSKQIDGEIFLPFFKEGGRFTLDNIHYVREGAALVPAGQTEFAQDKSFSYTASHLGEYIEKKTGGSYKKEDCTYISLEDLRALRLDKIEGQLRAVTGFHKVVVNAVDYVDVKIFAICCARAMAAGKAFIFRSAAAVPKVFGGIQDRPLLTREQLICPDNRNGGIVLIGSHVNKTTQQLEELHSSGLPLEFCQFDQHLVLVPGGLEQEVERVAAIVEDRIARGRNVVVYTRRERLYLDTDDRDEQLKISVRISDAVTSIVGRQTVRPNFIIAKGGITSSDVGTKALGVKKALVMGQIRPGIPVWRTGEESRFPGLPYIIFPGNVGERSTLREIVEQLAAGD